MPVRTLVITRLIYPERRERAKETRMPMQSNEENRGKWNEMTEAEEARIKNVSGTVAPGAPV